MSRRTALQMAVALAAVAALTGCGAIPQPRRDVVLEQAANKDDVAQILDHYREIRNAAISLLDPKPLSIVETGPMLAIDSGSFEVSQRLSRTQSEDERQLQVGSVETPEFSQYPLWFMVTAFDPAAKVDLVQIFERMTPVDPWLLVAAPQTLPSTSCPASGMTAMPRHPGRSQQRQRHADVAAACRRLLRQGAGSMTGSSGVARDDFIRRCGSRSTRPTDSRASASPRHGRPSGWNRRSEPTTGERSSG